MNQNTFREWQFEDTIKVKYEKEHAKPATPLKLSKTPMRQLSGAQQTATPQRSSVQRAALSQIDGNDSAPAPAVQDENLPAPTPGQPRKYARMDPRGHAYQRSTSAGFRSSMSTSHHQEKSTDPATGLTDSDEEFILQRLAARRSQSKSPNASAKGKGRSVSYTTTTTTTTKTIDMGDMGIFEDDGDAVFGDNDVEDTNAIWADHQNENISSPKKLSITAAPAEGKSPTRSPSLGMGTRARTPRRSASGVQQHGAGSGVGVAKTRSVRERESPMRRSTDEAKSRVRKTSGRVGSNGQKTLSQQR
jgi:cell division cycle 14